MNKFISRAKLAVLPLSAATLLGTLSACQDEEFGYKSEEIAFEKSFTESFGNIDPTQTWVDADVYSITLLEGQDEIRVFDGATRREVAHFTDVQAGQELRFNITRGYTALVTNGQMGKFVESGAAVSFAALTRATAEITTDEIGKTDTPIALSEDQMKSFLSTLPEEENNLEDERIASNFQYVSSGSVTVYPLYWYTAANLTIGIYYYENGEVKELDIYHNRGGNEYLQGYTASSVVTSVSTDKVYTLCCQSSAHGSYIQDNGTTLNGQSTEGSLFRFEATSTSGYYIQSCVTGKYLNCSGTTSGSAITFDSTPSTTWTVSQYGSNDYVTIIPSGSTFGLNNNTSNTYKLQLMTCNTDGNDCSHWTLTEYDACATCEGAGAVSAGTCATCDGTGTVMGSVTCTTCSGSGTCQNCNGNGYTTSSSWGPTTYYPCTYCGGTGNSSTSKNRITKGNGKCSTCSGTGSVTGTTPCTTCNGTGTATTPCTTCNGTGYSTSEAYWENIGAQRDAINSKYTQYQTYGITIPLPEGTLFGFYCYQTVNGTQYKYYSRVDMNTNCGSGCTGSGHHASSFPVSTTIDGINNGIYIGFEDWHNSVFDLNDMMLVLTGATLQNLDPQKYYMAFEDLGATGINDIDFNDCVMTIEAEATDNGNVEGKFTLMAAGGTFPIHVLYNGTDLFNNTEIHAVLKSGASYDTPINADAKEADYFSTSTMQLATGGEVSMRGIAQKVTLVVENLETGNTNRTVRMPLGEGEIPYGILLTASNWTWPGEGVSIKTVYPQFEAWVNDASHTNWADGWYTYGWDADINADDPDLKARQR